MKNSVILPVVLGFLLAGCATLNQADRDMLRQHRVSTPLCSKMTHGGRLSTADILELSEKRVSAPFIVHYLRSTLAVYALNSDDVVLLRQAGVNRQVIDYLLATPRLYAPQYDALWYDDDPFWWSYPTPIILRSHGDHHHHHHH